MAADRKGGAGVKTAAPVGSNRAKGAFYEGIAAEYLRRLGYIISEMNFTARGGEIDIIAEQNGVTVYCEVKYRSGYGYGDPLEAVDSRKRQRIIKAAMYHRYIRGYEENKPCRFDVIAVYGDGRIKHIENAFEA